MFYQVKVVYVRNLPDSVTEEQLQKLFERHGEVTKVVLPATKPGQAKRDFGFVHFSDRAQALKAIEKDQVYELEGNYALSSPVCACFW
jgi:heterogeneous nuclear ribonucleoprotein R